MLYLLSKIIIIIVPTALIGAWVGWMIRGLDFKQRVADLQNEWASRFRSTEQEKSMVKNQAKKVMQQYALMKKRLQETAVMLKRLTRERKAAQEKIDHDIAIIKNLSGKIEHLVGKIQRRDVRLKKYEHLLKTLQRIEADHKTRLKSSSSTIQQLIEQMQSKTSVISQLKTDLENISSSQTEAEGLSKDVKERYFELQAQLRDREIKLELAREQLDKQQFNSSELERELELIKNHVTTVPANDLAANVISSKQPVWLLSEPSGSADDLKAIKGIGPVMERLLHEVGIFHYNQLARMSETDVLWIAEKLKTFPKRIKNDRWQQQAVEFDLDRMGNGEFEFRDRSIPPSIDDAQSNTPKATNTTVNKPVKQTTKSIASVPLKPNNPTQTVKSSSSTSAATVSQSTAASDKIGKASLESDQTVDSMETSESIDSIDTSQAQPIKPPIEQIVTAGQGGEDSTHDSTPSSHADINNTQPIRVLTLESKPLDSDIDIDMDSDPATSSDE